MARCNPLVALESPVKGFDTFADPSPDVSPLESRADDDKRRTMKELVRNTETIWWNRRRGRGKSTMSFGLRVVKWATRHGGTICR